MKSMFKTRGEKNRFMKYGFGYSDHLVWKSEFVAARLVIFARKRFAQSK